jgi:hypothetical protein
VQWVSTTYDYSLLSISLFLIETRQFSKEVALSAPIYEQAF